MMNYVEEYAKVIQTKEPPVISGIQTMLAVDKIYKDLISRGIIAKAEPLVIARGNPVNCTLRHN